MERLHDGGLPQSRLAMDRLGAHAITIAAYGIERALGRSVLIWILNTNPSKGFGGKLGHYPLGTHFTMPSADGRGTAPRRFHAFSAGVVEGREVLEYDSLLHRVLGPNQPRPLTEVCSYDHWGHHLCSANIILGATA
jgi:hypothetical protein